jgi:hypothetical protein
MPYYPRAPMKVPLLILVVLLIVPGFHPLNAAEKITVPQFKNVDEAIGWVKAKGNCEKVGKDKESERCKIRIELPDEKVPEMRGESTWQVWSWIEAFDFEPFRNLTIDIVRSKSFLLSANDPKATVRSVKVSHYYFDKSGKVSEAYVNFVIENFRGEKVLDQQIPLSRDSIHKHGEGTGDLLLLKSNLGVGWDY